MLGNHRMLQSDARNEDAWCRLKMRTALSVAMFDLDYFKSVNDEYGHLCGDTLLAAVGKKLQEMLRNSDIKCRYGGEEFLILLP